MLKCERRQCCKYKWNKKAVTAGFFRLDLVHVGVHTMANFLTWDSYSLFVVAFEEQSLTYNL